MDRRNAAYLNDVDTLHDETSLERVLDHYGLPRPTGNQYRMPCVFNEGCNESSYGQLAIRLETKEIYCHSCGVRGNLYTLLHGLETHTPPSGRRLRGDEFKNAYRKLKEISGKEPPGQRQTLTPVAAGTTEETSNDKPRCRNVALLANEKTRSLANLYDDLVVDPAEMAPNAARYFRSRSAWLTPEHCRKWGVGYLPRSGRSMFKGWATYTHRNEQGQVLSYSGRDINYDDKLRKWTAGGSPADKKPMKHKFVKGYQRGLELYGQMAGRLSEPAIAESLDQIGLGVVEGMNDVIRLDALGVAAVGLCSNRATDEQVEKLLRFARGAARGRVWLMLDNDDEGEEGCKDLLWRLHERGLRPVLAWSRGMHGGDFAGRQPEDLTTQQWQSIGEHIANAE